MCELIATASMRDRVDTLGLVVPLFSPRGEPHVERPRSTNEAVLAKNPRHLILPYAPRFRRVSGRHQI